MSWVLPLGVLTVGALLVWGASRNAKAREQGKLGLQDAMIRGTDEPVPRRLPAKLLGGLLEHVGGQIGAVLLLVGLGGLIASL